MLSSPRESVRRARASEAEQKSPVQTEQVYRLNRFECIEPHKSRPKPIAQIAEQYTERLFTKGRHARCYLRNIASLSAVWQNKLARAMNEKKNEM